MKAKLCDVVLEDHEVNLAHVEDKNANGIVDRIVYVS